MSNHLRFKQAQPKMCHSLKVKDKVENQFSPSWAHIFRHFLNLWTAIRNFYLISKLKARPKYQLSADIHSHKLVLSWHTNCPWATFGYVQPWWAKVNHSKKKVLPNAIKAKTYQKVCFWQLDNIPGGQKLYTIPKIHNRHRFIIILSVLLLKNSEFA